MDEVIELDAEGKRKTQQEADELRAKPKPPCPNRSVQLMGQGKKGRG